VLCCAVHISGSCVQIWGLCGLSIVPLEQMFAERRKRRDPLSHVLHAVRLQSGVFYDNFAHDPWVAETPHVERIAQFIFPDAGRIMPFHVVVSGSCWTELTDSSTAPIRLATGDIVLLPGGDPHVLASAPGMREAPEIESFVRPLDGPLPIQFIRNAESGGPQTCRFICGFIGCDVRPFNPLLEGLPRLLVARTSAAIRESLIRMVEAAVGETDGIAAGAEAMLARVAEMLFVETIRVYADQLPGETTGWLAAMNDRAIGRALALIHDQPTRLWTVAELAKAVGLSRSGFAKRFAELTYTSPIEYLSQWRIQLAARLLEETAQSVAETAYAVGYRSEAAFRRAFERLTLQSPAAWRKSQLRA
jgi:AraC-like DNA-binding protein